MQLLSLNRSVYPYQPQQLTQSYRPSPTYSYQSPTTYQPLYQPQPQQLQSSYSPYLANSVKPMTAQPRVKQVDKYTIYLDYQVGSGASSVVYRGRNTLTGEEVCVKYVDCLQLQPGQKNMVLREAQFLRQLNHPNILKCTEVLDSGNSLYIICEYCSQGDLYEKLLKEGPLSQQYTSAMMKGLASALCTLKKYSIIHRDLKPSNVLLKDGVPKLADFGFAINQAQAREQTSVNIGSPLYMPPQVLFKNKYSFASDVFGFGIVYYELLHGITPWESNTEEELKAKLYYNPQLVIKQGISSEVKQLITCCLQMDPALRPTIEQVAACFG